MSHSLSLDRFIGKVAVVTGASSGIGKAIAETLVKQGVIVAGIARRGELLKDHAKQLSSEKGKLHAFQCDLTNQEQILSTFKNITSEIGPIHILVNNAAAVHKTTIIDGDIDKWKSVMDTNFLAVAICTREAVASMKSHDIKGHIINVNSVAGHMVPNIKGLGVYPSSKHALTGLTETVRLEINREKLPIKITCLTCGLVKTDILREAFGAVNPFVDRPKLETKDIADAVSYILATPEHVNVKELIVSVQGQEF